MSARGHINVVTIHGEQVERIDTLEDATLIIQRLRDENTGLHRDVNAWRIRYAEALRDLEAEALNHQLWPVGLTLFGYWREVCHHPTARWSSDRFWMLLPFLKARRPDPQELQTLRCKAAIAGLAYDHYTRPRKNGTLHHFTDWKHVFGSRDAFEERLAAAPANVKAKLAEAEKEAAAPKDRRRRSQASTQGTLDETGGPPPAASQAQTPTQAA